MWCWEGLGQGWGRVTGFLDSGFCPCTGTAMQPGATFGVGLRKKIGLQCPYADRSPRSRVAEGSARSGHPGGLTSPPPIPRWAGLGPQAGVMGCRQPARQHGAQRWRSAQSRSGDSRRHHVSREGAGRTGGVCHPAWGRQEEVAFPQDSEGGAGPRTSAGAFVALCPPWGRNNRDGAPGAGLCGISSPGSCASRGS